MTTTTNKLKFYYSHLDDDYDNDEDKKNTRHRSHIKQTNGKYHKNICKMLLLLIQYTM